MLKIIKSTILFVLCLVVLSGCFTIEGKVVGGKVKSSSNRILGDYRKFTGSASRDMEVKKGENWVFSFDETTKKGTITAYVVDSNDNTILEFNNGKEEKNIKVTKDDTYKVKIKTEEHGGEFIMS
ncbi:hypothetical protein [Bacillus arachidis]|uniref:hypothetical protein n=1 Tax=Bacillus arachidis TaxID=2819290 RepID=UPI00255CC692|nr:hypothetical protein [Bacillus arachidis]WIY63386.1 hypothetical protein QRY57_13475 [Bacillus arachidis]